MSMIKKFYKYRDELIFKQDNNKWIITNYDGEYDTLIEAYNTIDKRLGGWSGKCIPSRWLKDEQLKKEYEDYFKRRR